MSLVKKYEPAHEKNNKKKKKKKNRHGFPVNGSSSAHAQFPVWAPDMRVCLYLPQGLYYMSANSDGSGGTALMRLC